jgi:hypothetical protein
MYLVTAMKKKLAVEVLGHETDIPLVWSNGMLGAIPVFNSEESAKHYIKKNDLKGAEIFPLGLV